jgi:hypothetical protein
MRLVEEGAKIVRHVLGGDRLGAAPAAAQPAARVDEPDRRRVARSA